MAKLQPAEYPALKAFFRFFSDHFIHTDHLAPALRPLALIEASEPGAPAQASSSLRMAINDCLEMSAHWPPVEVSALDARLRGQGLLTLSQVRQRHWGRYAAVLKRELIRNQLEYELVLGVLSDEALLSTLDERRQLETLVRAYEGSAGRVSFGRG